MAVVSSQRQPVQVAQLGDRGEAGRLGRGLASVIDHAEEHALSGHIEPTQEGGTAFMQRGLAGPVTMLNLLRLRDVADYSRSPQLAPESPISGADAYRRYAEHTAPFIEAAGGTVVYAGEGASPVIGPMDERWDLVLLVRYPSTQAFLSFASDPAYLAGAGHRTAALEDSRLFPLDASTLLS